MNKTKSFLVASCLFIAGLAFSQAPEKMSYQAVIRTTSNSLVSNAPVGMRLSILQGSSSGAAVFVETQTVITNINGLASLEIGSGSLVSGSFTAIDWSNGPYFLKTEIDPTGATSYSITGTSQLVSVPFAQHARSAERSNEFIVSPNVSAIQPSAGLEVDYTNRGFLLPRVADTNAILLPAEGLQMYDLSSHCLRYRSNIAWSGCLMGDPTTVSVPTPISTGCNQLQNVNDYATVTNIPGAPALIWISRNLGATVQPISPDDVNDAAAGCYFQFNRSQAYGNDLMDGTTTVAPVWNVTPYNENVNWQVANDPCRLQLGSTWRVPTKAEWENVDAAGFWELYDDAFNSDLKLHGAGILISNGELFLRGSRGNYWSSTVLDWTGSWNLAIGDTFSDVGNGTKGTGFTLRCVK